MVRRAIVLANGYLEEIEALQARLKGWTEALIVAADGGSRHAAVLGLPLHVVVGDLDSLDEASRVVFSADGTHFEVFPARKDEADLELALLYAARQGADEIVVLGALGGRLDMALANILLLAHPRLADVHVELWSGIQTAWLIRPPGGEVRGQPGDTLSLIPLGGAATGITTQGLEYPLNNEALIFGPARGVSNVLTSELAYVSVRQGLLLAVHTPGRA
jgi:thiamine pyrophosphokinase